MYCEDYGAKPQKAERFLEFKLNLMHVIQWDKLKVGLFFKGIAKVIFSKVQYQG